MRTSSARRSARRPLLAALCTALALSVAPLFPANADPSPAPGTVTLTDTPVPGDEHCPYRVHTPPPVDDSEVVAPGKTTPTPLPVPEPPVGGEKLAACGIVADPAAGPVPDKLTSQGWLIADLESGNVIAAKDPHGRYRPASTIKILLALVALNELDLDAPVKASVNDWSMEGDACGVGPGGQYTVRDIVTGLLVVSGNDCANMLARELGGYDETLAKMNAEAKSLGALDTRAATPSGLDSAGMSTSPYDLAVIFRAAMANDEFRRMIGLKTYKFPGYPARKDVPGDTDHPPYMMGTSNTLLRDGVPGMTILGGKTGFTDDSLKTFVGAAESGGRAIVIVQMFGLNEADNSYHQQAVRMYQYGFAASPSISVGTLDTGRAGDDRSAISTTPGSGADSLAIGALPLILIGVAALSGASMIVLWFRRRRRSTGGYRR
ncbi:D-alanyl-D-alanine carboxypeptidase family protein [Gordonia iterans]